MLRTSARRRSSYRSSIFSQAQARIDSAFFMSVTTGCIRCGIFLYCDSSTFLGSIRIIFTSSGRLVIKIDRIIAFRQTDLPVPVLPAISRWGMSARSNTMGVPFTSLPRIQGDLAGPAARLDAGDHLAEPDHDAAIVGDLDADGRLARNRRHDPHAGHRQGDGQVVGQAHDPRYPQAGLQLDLELRDHRAGVDLDDANLVAEVEQRPLQQHGPGVDLGFVVLDRERRGGLQQIARRKLVGRTGLDGRKSQTASGIRGQRAAGSWMDP